jgi:hypothetical protein
MTATSEALTFVEFNRRLSAMPEYDEPHPKKSLWGRIGLATTIVTFLLAMVVQRLPLSSMVQGTLLLILVLIEIIGLFINFWNTKHEFVSLVHPLRDFAAQLDFDIDHHFAILDWLVSQPRETIDRYAALTRFRRERMNQKMPLLLGNFATLGVIPVVVGIYLQAREYIAGRHIGFLEAIVAFVLLMTYFLAWTTAITKARLDGMDMYLQEAVTRQAEAATPEAPQTVEPIPSTTRPTSQSAAPV